MNQKLTTALLMVAFAAVVTIGVIAVDSMLGYKETQTKEARAALWDEATALSAAETEPMVYVSWQVPNTTTPQRFLPAPNLYMEDGSVIHTKRGTEGEVLSLYSDGEQLWNFDLEVARYNIKGFHRDDEKNTYLLYVNGQKQLFMDVYSHNGELMKKQISILSCAENEVVHYTVYHKGAIYLMINEFRDDGPSIGKIMKYHLDTEILSEFIDLFSLSFVEADSFTFDKDDSVYLYGSFLSGGDLFVKLDAKGEQIFRNQHFNENRNNTTLRVVDEYIYRASSIDVEKYDLNGRYIETLVTMGYDTNFLLYDGFQTVNFNGNFDIDSEGNFTLGTFVFGDSEASRPIYKLNLTPKSSVPERIYDYELVITTSYKQLFLVELGGRYMVNNPNVKISFDTTYRTHSEFAENLEIAKTKLTAKLLTGNVGDIVAVAGMGVDTYSVLSKDIFMDLNELIENDASYEALNKADLEAIKIDGHIRGLPISMVNTSLVFNKPLADSLGISPNLTGLKWSGILDIFKEVKQHPEVALFGDYDSMATLNSVVMANIHDLIDFEKKTVDLKQSWFTELITNLKEAYTSEAFSNGSRGKEMGQFVDSKSIFEERMLEGHYDLNLNGHSKYGYVFLPMPYGELNKNHQNLSRQIYSISSASTQQQAAWDFLSYLVSYEAQVIYGLDMPLNLDAEQFHLGRISTPTSNSARQELSLIRQSADYMFEYRDMRLGIVRPLMEYLEGRADLETAINKAEYNVLIALNE